MFESFDAYLTDVVSVRFSFLRADLILHPCTRPPTNQLMPTKMSHGRYIDIKDLLRGSQLKRRRRFAHLKPSVIYKQTSMAISISSEIIPGLASEARLTTLSNNTYETSTAIAKITTARGNDGYDVESKLILDEDSLTVEEGWCGIGCHTDLQDDFSCFDDTIHPSV